MPAFDSTDLGDIQQLREDNHNALEGLVERHQTRALRTAYLICGDPDEAADIAQDAFLRAMEKIAQFDPSRPFAPWFMRIVVNLALKRCLTQARAYSLEGGETIWEEILASPQVGPEEETSRRILRERVREALRRLPPRERAALVMRYYLDMPEAEISRELGGPLGTVKWWLHRAKARLRAETALAGWAERKGKG